MRAFLAGPGTGKSFTLVAFLERLLEREKQPKVKLLTFTRAATAELAEKVAGRPAAGAEKPSTVHSFAISVLLRNPGTGNFPHPLRIADNWEQRYIVEPTLRKRAGLRTVYELRDLVSKMGRELGIVNRRRIRGNGRDEGEVSWDLERAPPGLRVHAPRPSSPTHS